MSDLHTKMAEQHFTIHEVIHFITDIPRDGVETIKKTCLERRGMLNLTQLIVSGSDSDCPQESV